MSAIPDKIEYRDCPSEKADAFVAAVEKNGLATRVSFSAANDKSHFDRYGFDCSGKRLGVVYDRKAKILSVTAPDDVSDRIKKLYSGLSVRPQKKETTDAKIVKKPEVADAKPAKKSVADGSQNSPARVPRRPEGKTEAADAKLPNKKKADTDSALSLQGAKRRGNLPEGKTETTDTNNSRPHLMRGVPKAGGEITKESKADSARSSTDVSDMKPAKKTPADTQKSPAPNDSESQGGNLSFKKFTETRFGDVVNKLKKRKGFKVAAPTVQDKGKQTETVTIVVASGNQKLKLRFMPKKQVLQVQGKQESLFSEVRLVVSEESDFKSAVTAHAESADKKASEFNRQLKKLMPTAVRYMSEQVKLDFTIGVIEILDSDAEHYDYSMLLLPPFRGLERLIFDIQRAQNVVVKMIGQAYEKENGEYVLKASYRRKINSVVYPEVLGALYREYFATRNFYTHSDAVGGENRVISTRKQAVDVFTHLCEVVEYNCRKLAEIGFSIAPPEKK